MRVFSRNSILVFLVLGMAPVGAFAHDSCVLDSSARAVCAPPNGGIALNRSGIPVCGWGQCLKNDTGRVMCSVVPGGFATINKTGAVVCTGGCVPAERNLCDVPKPYPFPDRW